MIEDHDDVALLPPGHMRPELLCADDDADLAADARNALSGTSLLPNAPNQSPRMPPERPREGLVSTVSGAFRMRVVKFASSSTKVPDPVVAPPGDGSRHDVGTHHSGHHTRPAPAILRQAPVTVRRGDGNQPRHGVRQQAHGRQVQRQYRGGGGRLLPQVVSRQRLPHITTFGTSAHTIFPTGPSDQPHCDDRASTICSPRPRTA